MILISHNVAILLYNLCIYLLCIYVLQDSHLTHNNFITRHCSILWQYMYEKHGYLPMVNWLTKMLVYTSVSELVYVPSTSIPKISCNYFTNVDR